MKRSTGRARRQAAKETAATIKAARSARRPLAAPAEPATTESAAEETASKTRIIKMYGPPTAEDQIVSATRKRKKHV